MAEIHEHLEHAEHASHHAHDPFERQVAVTMAIVAACLAGISMAGHRMHNRVLQLQGEANRARIEAAAAEVQKSNLFAWYQSKRNRQSQYETAAGLAKLLPASAEAAKTEPAATKSGKDPRQATIDTWQTKAKSYNEPNDTHDSLPELQEQGNKAGKQADDLHAEGNKLRTEAEHAHHRADRLDLAHLGAELGLVLSSLTLLTKRRGFWYTGIACAVVALALTGSAYLIPEEHEPPASEAAPH